MQYYPGFDQANRNHAKWELFVKVAELKGNEEATQSLATAERHYNPQEWKEPWKSWYLQGPVVKMVGTIWPGCS